MLHIIALCLESLIWLLLFNKLMAYKSQQKNLFYASENLVKYICIFRIQLKMCWIFFLKLVVNVNKIIAVKYFFCYWQEFFLVIFELRDWPIDLCKVCTVLCSFFNRMRKLNGNAIENRTLNELTHSWMSKSDRDFFVFVEYIIWKVYTTPRLNFKSK